MEKAKILKLLSEFVEIESVSTDPQRKLEIHKAAEFLVTTLSKLGFAVSKCTQNDAHPLVVGYYHVGDAAETVGIYAHYDVQPEDPLSEWKSPPFTLTRRNGKMFGRGIADDKGHIIANIAAIANLIQTKKLHNNIVCVFEGEEETGSVHFEQLLQTSKVCNKKVDVWFVTDMGARGSMEPQIFNGLRGIVYSELHIETSSIDCHSGVFGNRVHNPAQLLADIIAKAKDSTTGVVQIPGFYDHIIPPSKREYASLVSHADSHDTLMKRSGTYILPTSWGPFPDFPKNIPLALTSKLLPSFDVHGLLSGFVGEGEKTIIPRSAMMKFSCRIVPGQKPAHIMGLVKKFIHRHIPKGVHYELKILSQSEAFYTPVDDPWIQKAAARLSAYFGSGVTYNRSGGSIPAAEILQRMYGRPVILTGFTLPDENIHAPNENFDESMFWHGIKALERVYGQ